MKIFFFLLLLTGLTACKKSDGLTREDYVESLVAVQETSFGEYLVALSHYNLTARYDDLLGPASYVDPSSTYSDVQLIQLGPDGAVVSNQVYRQPGDNRPEDLSASYTPSVLVRTRADKASPGDDFVVYRLNHNLLLDKIIPQNSPAFYVREGRFSDNSESTLVGQERDGGTLLYQARAAAISFDGKGLFEKTYPGDFAQWRYELTKVADRGAWFGVRTHKQTSATEAFFWRADSQGNLVSEQKFGWAQLLQVARIYDADFVLVVQPTTANTQERAVVRLDASGKLLWSQSFSELGNVNKYQILRNSGDDGCSIWYSTPGGLVSMMRLDRQGRKLDSRTYPGERTTSWAVATKSGIYGGGGEGYVLAQLQLLPNAGFKEKILQFQLINLNGSVSKTMTVTP